MVLCVDCLLPKWITDLTSQLCQKGINLKTIMVSWLWNLQSFNLKKVCKLLTANSSPCTLALTPNMNMYLHESLDNWFCMSMIANDIFTTIIPLMFHWLLLMTEVMDRCWSIVITGKVTHLICIWYDIRACCISYQTLPSLIARFMGPTWGPSWADRTLVGPRLAPWTLLSGLFCHINDSWLIGKGSCTIEVSEWIGDFILHFIMDIVAYPWWDWS